MTSNLELRYNIRRGNVRKVRQLRAAPQEPVEQLVNIEVSEGGTLVKTEPEAPQTEIPLDLADTTDPDDEGVKEDPDG